MMTFKDYWLFCERKENMYSWMNPSGMIFPNGEFMHVEAARELITRFNLKKDEYPIRDREYDIMYKAGWVRVADDDKVLMAANHLMYPGESQIKSLKRMAEQNNMDVLMFDGGRMRTKTIWQNEFR